MKKLIKALPIILAITMLFSIGSAFASPVAGSKEGNLALKTPVVRDKTSSQQPSRDDSTVIDNNDRTKTDAEGPRSQGTRFKEFQQKTKQFRNVVQSKRGEIQETQRANRSLVKQIQNRIKQLRSEGMENLTPEHIEAIKSASLVLKQYANNTLSSVRSSQGLWSSYRNNIKDENYEGAKEIISQMGENYDTILGNLKETGDALATLLAALL